MTPVAWLLVGAGATMVALLFLLRRTRRRLGARPPPVARVGLVTRRPIEPVAPEAMAALPLPIRACPECGSPAIRPLAPGEGGIAGLGDSLDRQRCPRCAYEGVAVVFDRPDDYESFLRRLSLTWRATHGKP